MEKLFALFLLALPLGANAEVVKMKVEGLVCAFCASAIETKLRSNAATEDVLVSLEHRVVALSLKPGQDIADSVLSAQIVDAGYAVKQIERSKESLDDVRKGLKAASKQ
jgi:periplasmic mercuric ion binding protein